MNRDVMAISLYPGLAVEVVLRLHDVVGVQCPQLFDGGHVLGLHHRFKLADVVGVSDNEFDGVHCVCGLWTHGEFRIFF